MNIDVKINGVPLDKVVTHYKSFARWMRDDVENYLKVAWPKWKREFNYFGGMLRSGLTYMDIQELNLFNCDDFEKYQRFHRESGLFDGNTYKGDREFKQRFDEQAEKQGPLTGSVRMSMASMDSIFPQEKK